MSNVFGQRLSLPRGAVKLSSADFQREGFAFEDSLQVAAWLDTLGREGRAAPLMSVFAATRQVMALQQELLSGR